MVLACVTAFAAAGGLGWTFRGDIGGWLPAGFFQASAAKARPVPDPEKYRAMADELERWRLELSGRYKRAATAAERKRIEDDARVVLEEALPGLMRCWLGTPWDFSGTAETPGEGKIACGYFVATVLKDAGFRVDRYRLAQQPSQYIMETFLPKDALSLTMGRPYDEFADGLKVAAPGIYIVGLDTHVGFLLVDAAGFRMIHSSGASPWAVVEEDRQAAEVLRRSNWRMLGNFSADDGVVRSWLRGEKIEVRKHIVAKG